MRYFWIFTLLVATAGFMAGCCGSDCATPTDEGNAAGESTDQAAEGQTGDQASTARPAEVVHAFLEAARIGDDRRVVRLLTPTARREVGRVGLNIAPPASDTARFEIGETRKSGEKQDVAHVESRWIEQPRPSAEPKISEMAWALRLTDEGWRIGGMAMFPFEGEPPLLLDYEKPAEVMEKYKMLKAEIARRKMAIEQETTLR